MSPSYSLALGGRVPVCVSPASSDGSQRPQLQPPGVQDTAASSRAPHRPPVWSAHRPRVRDHQTGMSDNRGAPRESPRRLLLYQVHILPIAHVCFPPPFLPSSTTSIAFCYTQERQTKPFLCPIFLSFYRIFAVHPTSGSVGPRKKKLQKRNHPTHQTTQISTDRGIEPRSHSRQDVFQSPQLVRRPFHFKSCRRLYRPPC